MSKMTGKRMKLDVIVDQLQEVSEARISSTLAGLRLKAREEQDDCLAQIYRSRSIRVTPDDQEYTDSPAPASNPCIPS